MLVLVLGGLLTSLTACLGGGSTGVRDIQSCFSQLPASHVHLIGSTISFSVTSAHRTSTYTLPETAFGGAPAALENGDLVTFCAQLVDIDGHSTTTITQFSDLGQPVATGTPQSG
jgi:hypothetical protein